MATIGYHPGQVVDITDPNGQGRVRCLSASLFGQGVISNWIEMTWPVGYYAVPNVGDKVALIAENMGDVRHTYCLGLSMSHNTKDGPANVYNLPFDPLLPGTQIAIISKTGLFILIDDTAQMITLSAPNTLIDGDVEITGDLIVDGNITTPTGDVIAGTISLKNHIHSDPQGGFTGPPVP